MTKLNKNAITLTDHISRLMAVIPQGGQMHVEVRVSWDADSNDYIVAGYYGGEQSLLRFTLRRPKDATNAD